jgi:hypothetical protein
VLSSSTKLYYLIRKIWSDYFKKPTDTISGASWALIYTEIRDYFFSCAWNEVYDFVEFVAHNYDDTSDNRVFMDACNQLLKRKVAGCRFVGGKITEVTGEEEIAEIEEALKYSKPSGTIVHLGTALALLSNRTSPDYRNSIKESISAVETICVLIAGKSATLGDALAKIRRDAKVSIHPALIDAFDKLYGYTSDADGIRHRLMQESNLDFEDAKFMLVACSSFVNYLRVKALKAGINFIS